MTFRRLRFPPPSVIVVASSCICAYSFHSLSHLHRNSTASSTRPPMCESVAFRPSLVSHSKSDAKRQKVVTDVTIGDRYMAGGEVTPLLTTDQYDGNAKYPDHESQFLQLDVLVASPHSATMSKSQDMIYVVLNSTTHCEHGKLSPISSTQHLSLLSLPWASDRLASPPSLFLSHALAAFPFNGVAL